MTALKSATTPRLFTSSLIGSTNRKRSFASIYSPSTDTARSSEGDTATSALRATVDKYIPENIKPMLDALLSGDLGNIDISSIIDAALGARNVQRKSFCVEQRRD